jgi:hypothetical protein
MAPPSREDEAAFPSQKDEAAPSPQEDKTAPPSHVSFQEYELAAASGKATSWDEEAAATTNTASADNAAAAPIEADEAAETPNEADTAETHNKTDESVGPNNAYTEATKADETTYKATYGAATNVDEATKADETTNADESAADKAFQGSISRRSSSILLYQGSRNFLFYKCSSRQRLICWFYQLRWFGHGLWFCWLCWGW